MPFFFLETAKAFELKEKTTSTEKDIAFSDEWLALVHYRPAWPSGVKSTIDSPSFFLAKDGKTNPEAELRATLALFNGSGRQEEKCLFPARRALP